MADLPSNPLLPSSPATAPSDATGQRSSPSGASVASTALAFLVHSPTTVEHNLPPDVDNKPLARQKRRRTSKEDEEILKAEYLRNPKPDKAARMEIVSKVALGEKEVQVWFQNKRQNDRRRARPLNGDANSSDSAIMSSSSLSSDPASPEEHELNEPKSEQTERRESVASKHSNEEIEEVDKHETTSAESPFQSEAAVQEPVKEGAQATETDTQSTENLTVASTDPQTVETAPTEPGSSQQTIPASQEASQPKPSYLANRRSASFRAQEEASTAFARITTEPTTRTLNRTRSFVRLSMTADGTARVLTDADQSPSPPPKRPCPSDFDTGRSLRRSYSAAGLNDRLAAAGSGEPSPKVPRFAAGRSRDSRAWEFWCDPDSRNSLSLTTKAEQEGSGSAADAISLIRANSRRRSVLGQNQSKRNTPMLSRQDTTHSSVKKSRSFRRAETTHGRLQTKTPSKSKKADDTSIEELLPQTESDKENWEPEEFGTTSQRRRRPNVSQSFSAASQRTRHILGENTEIMSQSTSLGAMLERARGEKKGTPSKVTDPERDDELRLFMSSSADLSARTNVSTGEELGCVEGLLKLSRGDWR
ncbi:hypothetical protein GQ43DRAFT_438989 [Delitschia confertaspora ATCC 74209]|uniref:Homeobox domain-containing protein n=1 Tax=Delitschia confertaspora ATCC 74209 TaxID=1513339 RepID=A0A9P4JVC9_9PLEO|nr:hypothetical protein GQ43DRAFT_438989 [Delitschia confertaspora ATCC 74209]